MCVGECTNVCRYMCGCGTCEGMCVCVQMVCKLPCIYMGRYICLTILATTLNLSILAQVRVVAKFVRHPHQQAGTLSMNVNNCYNSPNIHWPYNMQQKMNLFEGALRSKGRKLVFMLGVSQKHKPTVPSNQSQHGFHYMHSERWK